MVQDGTADVGSGEGREGCSLVAVESFGSPDQADQPHLEKILPVAALNLKPDSISVCNNASWAIGEIAMKVGADVKPYVKGLMTALEAIITVRHDVRSMTSPR